MPSRSSHFNEIVLIPLFVLFICGMVEESGQILSKPRPEGCLRKCDLAREESSTTEVSRFLFCYHKCLNWNSDQHALSKNIFRQRTRKSALAPNPDCPNTSPGHFEEWTPSNVNVSFGQYENTSCWYVNVSWTPINDTYGNWTGILVRLTIPTTDQFISPVTCFVQPTNQTFLRINISSYHYHYPDHIFVNIISLPYYSFSSDPLIFEPNIPTSISPTAITETSKPSTAAVTTGSVAPTSITRSSTAAHSTGSGTPTSITRSSTADHSTGSVAPTQKTRSSTTYHSTDSNNTVAYAVSISSGILVGLALVGGLLAHFLCRKKCSIPLPSEYKYHAFIIYSNGDKPWMKEKLLTLLEEKHHLKCCVHYRDFVIGRPFRDNMANSVYESNKVIALFSSNSVNSNYWKYELDLAISRQLAKRDGSLVVIRIDGVTCEQLPSELKDKSFIDYSDHLERPLWRRKLLNFLGLSQDSGTHTVTEEQNCDNNNSNGYPDITNTNRPRTGFSRLDSTTSNASEISYV